MELTRLLGYSGGSFAIGLVSGLVPAVNTEAYQLMLAALAPRQAALPAVVCVTAGQMVAKGLLYLAGSGAMSSRFLAGREGRLAGMRQRLVGGSGRLIRFAAIVTLPGLLGAGR